MVPREGVADAPACATYDPSRVVDVTKPPKTELVADVRMNWMVPWSSAWGGT